MKYSSLTSENISRQISQNPVALLPIGAIEAHGAHLPLETDNLLAEELCKRVSKETGAFILPTISYGQVWSLGIFPGSFHIPQRILEDFIYAVCVTCFNNSFKSLVFINTHLGNSETIKNVQRKLAESYPNNMTLNLFYPTANKYIPHVLDNVRPDNMFFHADELETSYMLYLCPNDVDMSKAVNEDVLFPEEIQYKPIRWKTFSQTAVMGYARDATKEKGKAILDPVIKKMVRLIKNLY